LIAPLEGRIGTDFEQNTYSSEGTFTELLAKERNPKME